MLPLLLVAEKKDEMESGVLSDKKKARAKRAWLS